jgi:serine protease Do
LHRATASEESGVVVHFVKPNSPAAVAGLRPDDWIREIDGAEVMDFAEAITRLAAIDADARRAEFVLLTRRGGETQVLRVKLN